MSDFRNLLVPYDFSAHSRAALRTAVEWAERFGAEIDLVHVIQNPAYAYGYGGVAAGTMAPAAVAPPIDMQRVREDSLQALREVAREVEGAVKVGARVVEGPNVAGGIVRAAEESRADLIVMGTHGRTGIAHVFLGSATERTLRNAPCPVLAVRATEEDEDSGDA